MVLSLRLLACLLLSISSQQLFGQEIEPRRWTHTPTGLNFVGVAYAYTDGNIFLDPSIQIEGAQAQVHGMGLGFVHSFGLFGKSARFDMNLPYAAGRWEGFVDGELVSTERTGLGDPQVRLSLLLAGAPALTPTEFAGHKSNTILGAAVKVTVPLGEYDRNRLINLGSNRWVVKPQLGVVHTIGKWTAELTGEVWLYGDNDARNGAQEQKQDPLYSVQGHLIYTVRPGLWTSISAGYGTGARSNLNGELKDDEQRNFIWAASLGYAFTREHGIKVTYFNGSAVDAVGTDFNRLQIGYSYMWGDGN